MSDSAPTPRPGPLPSRDIAPSDRVPVRQKIAYGLGSTNDVLGNWLYPSMVWPVFNIYLLVPPSLVSTALLVNRLTDAVSDPFFGWISDNTRSRFGRRRPYILLGSILADVIDCDELETGKRREGAFNACSAWIMKVGMAVGMGVSGVILENTGFDAALTGSQSEHTLAMIRLYLAAIPVSGLVIAFIAIARLGLTPSRMADIRQQLEERRGKIGATE